MIKVDEGPMLAIPFVTANTEALCLALAGFHYPRSSVDRGRVPHAWMRVNVAGVFMLLQKSRIALSDAVVFLMIPSECQTIEDRMQRSESQPLLQALFRGDMPTNPLGHARKLS